MKGNLNQNRDQEVAKRKWKFGFGKFILTSGQKRNIYFGVIALFLLIEDNASCAKSCTDPRQTARREN